MVVVRTFKKLLVPTLLLFTSACNRDESKSLNFSANVFYKIDILPDFVQIQLANDSADYICLENSEINGRGGNIVVDKFIVTNVGSPAYILEKDGVYLGDGITIVGPKSTKGQLIELEKLTDKPKNVKNITMTLRYFKCEDIFRKNHIPEVHSLAGEWRKSI